MTKNMDVYLVDLFVCLFEVV